MLKKFKAAALVFMFLFAIGQAFSFAEESRYVSDAAVEAIRARIRAEAGIGVNTESAESAQRADEPKPFCDIPPPEDDLPMVAVTALKGDTLDRLAIELTGTKDAARIIAASAGDIQAGEKILLPRTLLKPRLSDPETTRVTLPQGQSSMKAFVAANLRVSGAEADVEARNLLRLNGFSEAATIKGGEEFEVPNALLKNPPRKFEAAEISDEYRASGSRVVAKKVKASKKGKKARYVRVGRSLEKRGSPIDLVVIHTTEHSGGSIQTVASYIRKNHLAHYVVGPKGEIYRVVPEEAVAHGAGEAIWDGDRDVNSRAINIEIYADTLMGPKYTGINDAQYAGLKRLLDDIRGRRPDVHSGRVVTHSMVAMSFKYKTRSRKGDPYEFDWAKAGLPDNIKAIDQDVLLGRVSLCYDKRYADRITPGQEAAKRFVEKM